MPDIKNFKINNQTYDITAQQLSTPDGIVKEIIVPNYDTSTLVNNNRYNDIKYFIRHVCDLYPNVQQTKFKGQVANNGLFTVEVYIYDTSDRGGDEDLPKYCHGICMSGYGNGIYWKFGTYNYTWWVSSIALEGGEQNPIFGTISTGDKLQTTHIISRKSELSQEVGIIKITLPANGHTTMLMFDLYVYQYNSKGGANLAIGGYTYADYKWYNVSLGVKGHIDYKVRLGYDGSHMCILLGETTTRWSYPQVWLNNVFSGYRNVDIWRDPSQYSISLITSESGLSNLVELNQLSTRPQADSTLPTVVNRTWYTGASLTLAPGNWLVIGKVSFPYNSGGDRSLILSTNGTNVNQDLNNANYIMQKACINNLTRIENTSIFTLSEQQTIYTWIYQDSGSTINNVMTHLMAKRID